MNLVVNGELVKVKEIKIEKFTVYLGKYASDDSSYERVAAKNEESIAVSMDDTELMNLFKNHSGFN